MRPIQNPPASQPASEPQRSCAQGAEQLQFERQQMRSPAQLEFLAAWRLLAETRKAKEGSLRAARHLSCRGQPAERPNWTRKSAGASDLHEPTRARARPPAHLSLSASRLVGTSWVHSVEEVIRIGRQILNRPTSTLVCSLTPTVWLLQ